jgi:5-hydroxyisourate hydrolase
MRPTAILSINQPYSMTGPTISTHVLDVGKGSPAADITVELFIDQTLVASSRTDSDGRIPDLAGELETGSYRLSFSLGEYFGGAEHLFDRVMFDLELTQPRRYHVPLLLSNFSCTSYRGS